MKDNIMQILTQDHMYNSVKKYMADNKLGAQAGHTIGRYLYSDGSRCAIGCALDDNTIKEITDLEKEVESYLVVSTLAARKLIAFENDKDMEYAINLQREHDAWCCVSHVYTPALRQDAEYYFMKVLEND